MTMPPNPPPAGPPRSAQGRPGAARRWLPLAVVGAIAVIGLGTWGVVAATSSGGQAGEAVPPERARNAPNVSRVAGQVVAAARGMDIDAGLALLCDTPSSDQIDDLDDWINQAKSEAGTDQPEFSLEVSDVVENADGGSFRISAQGAGAIADRNGVIDVEVAKVGGKYCVDDVDVVRYAVRTSE